MTRQYILALDQGTTSSRAIIFDHHGRVVSKAQKEFPQILPAPNAVEHDPEAIWQSQLEVARQAVAEASMNLGQIAAVGITNQRETVVLWDRQSGKPVHNAIVWQSRVSQGVCQRLKKEGCEETIRAKTGLLIDPYFSGTKIRYLMELYPGLHERAARGDVLFGTIDTFLTWRLSGGKLHVTDVSNASRTLLFNLHTLEWDDELLELMGVPRAMLPEVVESSQVVGQVEPSVFGDAIPIAGRAGDQQAATFGQGCFDVGAAKNTYGTGCFLLLNTGPEPVASQHNLLTTIGWSLNGKVTYCLEGAIFIGGAVVQWLRDGLGMIEHSADVEPLAASVPDSDGVVFVPAFVGLGAPHWDPDARGAILGLTRRTTAAHVARAALDAMAFQTHDLLDAMHRDTHRPLKVLNVDGGASVNNALMQFQADLLGVPVRRPQVAETTALGAAYLAGLAVGYWDGPGDVQANWCLDREFAPQMPSDQAERLCARWARAVQRAGQWESECG
jgi:glycerol kinase